MQLLNKNRGLYGIAILAILIAVIFSSCKKDEEKKDNENSSSFCYSFVKSIAEYDTIVGGTDIKETNEDDMFEIDLGYTFTFCEKSFQKIYIAWDYQPTFTYKSEGGVLNLTGYELSFCGTCWLDFKWGPLPGGGNGNLTRLKYQTTGSPGDRITTIEWRDFTFQEAGLGEEYTINCEIKLYENGNRIVFHYGPNDVETDFNNTLDIFAIGIYAENPLNGLFLSGDPADPSTASSPVKELNFWPKNGTLYTFK